MFITPGPLLKKINSPDDVKKLDQEQLVQLCAELRSAGALFAAFHRRADGVRGRRLGPATRGPTAIESAPSFETKNVSTIANNDSIDISRIIGIARMIRAAGIEPFVKSRVVPTNASRRIVQKELSTVSADGVSTLIDIQIKF